MRKKNFIELFNSISIYVVIVFSLLQIAFFVSLDNIICVFIAGICWLITGSYILRYSLYQDFPFSSTIIVGFSLTQFAFPLIFTLLEGKPLVFNLSYPIEILIHSTLALFVLIIVHSFYVQKQINSFFSTKNKWQLLLKRVDLFSIPNEKQLWLMGLVGQLATILNTLIRGIASSNETNIGLKFFEGFIVFAVAPYFLVMKKLYSNEDNNPIKFLSLKLTLYTILQIMIAIIVNSRATFIAGLTGLGICYFVGLLINKYDYKNITISKLFIFLVISYTLNGPLNDISIAMLVVRGQRTDLSATQLLSETLVAYNDKVSLKDMKIKLEEEHTTTSYSETYLNSIFLSRFCNLKFNDNGLISYHKIGGVDEVLLKYTYDRFLAIFPDPVLKIFGIYINKKQITESSYGDYIFDRAGGEYALGGLRVGHFAGTGLATFGWYYLLFLAIFTYPLFFLFDLFVLKIKNNKSNDFYILSLAGLSSILTAFLFYTNSTSSESVTSILNFLIRSWIQIVLLYIVIFKITKIL